MCVFISWLLCPDWYILFTCMSSCLMATVLSWCGLSFPQDVVIKGVTGLAFFCGGIPLAVHADEWRFWMGQADSPEQNEMFNIGGIVSTTSAAAVSGVLHVYMYTCM